MARHLGRLIIYFRGVACILSFDDELNHPTFRRGVVMARLPDYVTAAKPVPWANRAPWYKTITPTYAGVMLWFVFWQDLAKGGGTPGGVLHGLDRLGLSRTDSRGRDLPFLFLHGAGHAGHEDRSAAVRGGHLDLRGPRRVVHARFSHGRCCNSAGWRVNAFFVSKILCDVLWHRASRRSDRRPGDASARRCRTESLRPCS